MSKPKGRNRRLLVSLLAGLGATFACLAAVSASAPGGIFAGLSTRVAQWN
jgi:hypothetical protein